MLTGEMLGPYRVLDKLGEGGMGEVYRGRDTKLGREVAVKALPDALAQDPDRLARFEREAQVLASLNHPNIAIIHELKEAGGSKYLILELVEGETLAERIARGPLPLDEALDIARQMAEGLEAAHERGVVHRDLKPANVKITPEGRVKVLDFGLAKIYESSPAGSRDTVANSPTLSVMQTAGGLILGTAAYMSPEQARGKNVDRRGDVWAFGCVLYEMLTGRQAFASGETVSDTLANVLKSNPDWSALPADTPQKIRALVERCLRKDARRRWSDLGDARIEVEDARSAPDAATVVASSPRAMNRWRYVWMAPVAALFLSALGVATRHLVEPAPDERTVRFDVFPPEGAALLPGSGTFHLSPDGRRLAFVARSESKPLIFVRSLEASTAEPLPSTEGVGTFFWSADSQNLAFIADGKLRKLAVTGGPSVVLCDMPNLQTAYTGDWNAEGVLLLSGLVSTSVFRVPATGGRPAPATQLDAFQNEQAHLYPHFLPDGRHFLYLATSNDRQNNQVYVGTLDSNERRLLPGITTQAKYSPDGHLVFVRDGALMAQAFDVGRFELIGDAFPLADPFIATGSLNAPFSVSADGGLAYKAGSNVRVNSQLVWFDRGGKAVGVAGPVGDYDSPELSPDGRSVAFARGVPADIWILDIARGLSSRFTTSPISEFLAVWSPGSDTLAFDSNTRDGRLIYRRAVDVIGEDQLLLKRPGGASVSDWSRDGRYVAYTVNGQGGGVDVWTLPLAGDRKPLPIATSAFNEREPRISPDGRWIAYSSNESGSRDEIYVQSFPNPGARKQVSIAGGVGPRWRRDGKDLYYLSPDLTLMAVSIASSGSALQVGAPTALFQMRNLEGRNPRNYDVSADGRFLVNVSAEAPSVVPITVILNWAANRQR